jgi:hypothetical protein
MATDVIIVFESLQCTRESDGTGHSEPYIWPVLLWVDDNTLATPSLVGVIAPAIGNARVVIKSDMRAGQTADIPASVGELRLRVEDGLTLRRLIFVVALWEDDETPEAAMRAGFLAFSSELRAALADKLFALFAADQAGDGEQKNAIIAGIKSRVRDRVQSAIENALTGWQKVRVFLGTLDLDDFIDSAFGDFAEHPVPAPIALSFTDGPSDLYSIRGNLQILPVHVDLCQAQVDAVKEAQIAVDGVDNAIKELQKALSDGPANQKAGIIAQIKHLQAEDLVIANAALDDARRALSSCRSRTPPPFSDPVGTSTTGLG